MSSAATLSDLRALAVVFGASFVCHHGRPQRAGDRDERGGEDEHPGAPQACQEAAPAAAQEVEPARARAAEGQEGQGLVAGCGAAAHRVQGALRPQRHAPRGRSTERR